MKCLVSNIVPPFLISSVFVYFYITWCTLDLFQQVKFDVDFNKVLPTQDKQNEFEQMVLTEYSNLWPDVLLSIGSIREGMYMEL